MTSNPQTQTRQYIDSPDTFEELMQWRERRKLRGLHYKDKTYVHLCYGFGRQQQIQHLDLLTFESFGGKLFLILQVRKFVGHLFI